MAINKKPSSVTAYWRTKLANSKKQLFLGLAIVAALVVGVSLWIQSLMNVVASVDGHKITRAELNDITPRLQRFWEYSGDNEALADPQKAALNYLVEDKIVRVEAEKRSLKVDQAAVDRQYQNMVAEYKTEADYAERINLLYGWTPELTKQVLSRTNLRAQLEPLVVEYRSGKFIAAQHLAGGGLTELSVEGYAQRAEDTINRVKGDIDKSNFDTVYKNVDKYSDPAAADPLIVTASEFKWARHEAGIDAEGLESVYGAREGDVTAVVKTSTLYGIHKVEQVSSGEYASWEEFIDQYPHRLYESRLQPWYKAIWKGFAGKVGPSEVYATAPPSRPPPPPPGGGGNSGGDVGSGGETGGTPTSCGSATCHAAGLSGTVTDKSTGLPLGGVSVDVFSNDNKPTCLSHPNDPACKCGPKNKSTSTGGGGNYSFARQDGTQCFVNCFFANWKASFSKQGYDPVTISFNPTNGYNTIINVQLAPKPAIVIVHARQSETGGYLGVNMSSSGNLSNHGGTTTIQRVHSGAIDELYTAPASAGGVFTYDEINKWSGCSGGNSSPSTRNCRAVVQPGQTQTITAWYKTVSAPPPPAEPDPDPPVVCSPSARAVTTGTPATYTASGGNGSTYSWQVTPSSQYVVLSASNNTLTITSNAAGTFSISVSSGNGTPGGCSLTVTSPPPPPPPPASGDQPPGNLDFDQGERPPVY